MISLSFMNMNRFGFTLCMLCLIGSIYLCTNAELSMNAAERCFCKLKGALDDCQCKIEQLVKANNLHFFPILQSLLRKSYFRFYRVNLKRPCPYWSDDSKCAMKNCHVKDCTDDEIPHGIKSEDEKMKHEKAKYLKPNGKKEKCTDDNHGGLGDLDMYLSEESKAAFQNWSSHDDQQNTFCELDDDPGESLQYVDLGKNPERYTGYAGPSAHRVWNSIYQENCFMDQQSSPYGFGNLAATFVSQVTGRMCLEKRVFYRLISGLHTSINVHLCWNYLLKDERGVGGLMSQTGQVWGPNVDDFQRRFDPKNEPNGPQRLRNLFFALLVEVRALQKVSNYLKNSSFYTGIEEDDIETHRAVSDLLNSVNKFNFHFDETKLFQSAEAKPLKEEFRKHFLNITHIMDCVGCDKCRLWGKLQVMGMGTALKILFTPQSIIDAGPPAFQLRRPEISALLNAIGRLSFSARHIQEFRELLKNRN